MNKPSYEEVFDYCESRHRSVDPVAFFLHYESNGWYVGKVPMKNWKAAVANWDRMQQTRNGGNQYANQLPQTFAERDDRTSIEAARRIRETLGGNGNDGNQDRTAILRKQNAPTPRRLNGLFSTGD